MLTAFSLGELRETEDDEPWSLVCLYCYGEGCDLCGGMLIEWNACRYCFSGSEHDLCRANDPLKTYLCDMQIADIFEDVAWLLSKNIPPVQGSRSDQTAFFLDCVKVVERTKEAYRRIKERSKR